MATKKTGKITGRPAISRGKDGRFPSTMRGQKSQAAAQKDLVTQIAETSDMVDELTGALKELLPAAMNMTMKRIKLGTAKERDVFYAYAVLSDKRSLLMEQQFRLEESAEGGTAMVEKRLQGLAMVETEYKRRITQMERTVTPEGRADKAIDIVNGVPTELAGEVIDAEAKAATGDQPKELEQRVGQVPDGAGQAPADGARQPLPFEGGEGPYAVPDEDGGETA